jgi:hypothetical protein
MYLAAVILQHSAIVKRKLQEFKLQESGTWILRGMMRTKLQVLLVIFITQKFIFEIVHSNRVKAKNND